MLGIFVLSLLSARHNQACISTHFQKYDENSWIEFITYILGMNQGNQVIIKSKISNTPNRETPMIDWSLNSFSMA